MDAMFVSSGSDPTNVVVLAFDSILQVDGVEKASMSLDSKCYDIGCASFVCTSGMLFLNKVNNVTLLWQTVDS